MPKIVLGVKIFNNSLSHIQSPFCLKHGFTHCLSWALWQPLQVDRAEVSESWRSSNIQRERESKRERMVQRTQSPSLLEQAAHRPLWRRAAPDCGLRGVRLLQALCPLWGAQLQLLQLSTESSGPHSFIGFPNPPWVLRFYRILLCSGQGLGRGNIPECMVSQISDKEQSQRCEGASLCWLLKASDWHLFPVLPSVKRRLGLGPGRRVYTTEIGKCYKSGRFPPREPVVQQSPAHCCILSETEIHILKWGSASPGPRCKQECAYMD